MPDHTQRKDRYGLPLTTSSTLAAERFIETGYVEEAHRLAQRSLALRPTNAIAAHSVAHVFFETGDSAGGGDFLATWLKGFDKRAPYHVHLSWHQACSSWLWAVTSGCLTFMRRISGLRWSHT